MTYSNSNIKNQMLIRKSRKNIFLQSLLKKKSKRKFINLSKDIFFNKYTLVKNRKNIMSLLSKNFYINNKKNVKAKQNINNILLKYLICLKNQQFKKSGQFYENRTLLMNFYLRLISLYLANEYLLIHLIKNIKNYPYSILIVYLNRSIRFWSVLNKLIYVFISSIKVSKSPFFTKINDFSYLNFSKKLRVTIEKNKVKSRLWEIKTKTLKLKLPPILIKPKTKNNIYNSIKIAQKKGIKYDFKWFYFYKNMKILSLKKVRLLNFENINFTKIKNHLWKINRKLHTQNSFNWLFKKYWLILKSSKLSETNQIKNIKIKSQFKTKHLIFLRNVLQKRNYEFILSTYYFI